MTDVFSRREQALDAAVTLGQMKRSTRRSYASVVTRHLEPAFGRFRSDELTTVQVANWKTTQAARVAAGTLAPKTFNNAVGVLSACLEWAREQHLMAANPLPKKLRATIARKERPIVQGAEIKRLWQATEGEDRVNHRTRAVRRSKARGNLRGPVERRDLPPWPDAGHVPRRASLCPARDHDAEVRRRSPTGEPAPRLVTLLREHERTRPPVPLDDGTAFLIRQDDGQPVDPDNWCKRVLPAILDAAKLPKGRQGIGLHALRHTFGSLLLADGAPVKHVSEQMGHANPTITMQVYQHVLRATSATATRQLDKHIPAESGKPRLRLVKTGAA